MRKNKISKAQQLQRLAKKANQQHQQVGMALCNALEHAKQCGDTLNQIQKIMKNSPEGTRTLNLRIDSPKFRFVSTCELSVYDGKKTTYGADWGATGVALGAN